ncbi:hypothetical protein [Aneurinibacillus sp. REN35]|uniref:hypothetical protein n=1 Tax=Aneurinibacillus sp. REN35 TaxID=3237286 RepID=UPI003527D399
MNKYPEKTEILYDQSREMQLKQTLDELESELNKPIWKEFIEDSAGPRRNS